MSPTIVTLPAQPKNPKGKKVPGKKGRFDPDQPLHMTTRRGGAAKTSMSGSAPSANGSVEDFESRRASLDGERPVTAHSNGSKGTYASDFSPPQPVPDINMSEAHPLPSFDEAINGERESRSPSRAQQTSPHTLKRKRSSPSPPPVATSDFVDQAATIEGEAQLPEDYYDSDNVQVLRQDELSDREESDDEVDEVKGDSAGSSQSQEAVPSYDAVAGTSVDVTPMISEQPSPATSGTPEEDDEEPDTNIAKPLAAALHQVAQAKKDDPAKPELPEDVPMLDAAQAIEDADEIEEQVRTDEEGRMVVRRGRFGGRRRAQHPNINIEAAMRRQAQLKSAYRAVARAQKNILAEVTQRTVDDLEASSTYHTEVEEYEAVMEKLDAALAKRKSVIQAQHEMRLKQLKTTWDAEQDAIVSKCRQQLEDVEEAKVDQLQYVSLQIARSAQLEDGNETEDEDDVIPRLKRTAYHFKRGSGLDPVYDSRSRLAIETRRATEDMQARYDMYEMIKQLPNEDKPDKRNGFTVMDERPRTAASTNREGQGNLEVLAAASAETERKANIPIIPNEQAVGLQMLSDLASRPSIVGGRPESSSSMSGKVSAGPPQLHVQVPRGPSPIQLTMSPRTQHAMGNRFESNHMPPPLTPRQDASAPADRSPEARRHERQSSTPSRDDHPNGLHAQPGNEVLRSPARPPVSEASSLMNRIASRDGMLQDRLFGSPRGFSDFPGFRHSEAPDGPRRRAASHSDPAPPFGFHSDTSLGMRRDEERRELAQTAVREEVRQGAPRYDPVRSEASRYPDQPSQGGASNGRIHETTSPKSEMASHADTPGRQNSAAFGQDAGAAIEPSNNGRRGSKGGNFPKTNKDQRGGKSRKQMAKEKHQQQQAMGNGRPESAGTPTMGNSQYAGSPAMDMRSQSPWSGPPPLGMSYRPEYGHDLGPFHHARSYGPPHHAGFPQNPMHDHHRRSSDLNNSMQHHRESYGPPYGPPPPPSPFYPGPPGVPPEHYLHGFPPRPPPPPGAQNYQPPGPPPGPQTQQPFPGPQSAPGSGFGVMPRGPPIASAGGFQGNFRGHLPAFAQQQQLNGGDRRRRTQSDVGFAKFQPPWQPKGMR